MRSTLSLCLFVLTLASCGGETENKARPAALVEAQPIQRATFTDNLEAVGTALANEQVVLSAPVTERITSIYFTDGAHVSRGQVIATLAVGQELADRLV